MNIAVRFLSMALIITSVSAMESQNKSSFWSLPDDPSRTCEPIDAQAPWCKFISRMKLSQGGEGFIVRTDNNTQHVEEMLSDGLSFSFSNSSFSKGAQEKYFRPDIYPLYGHIQFLRDEDITLSYQEIDAMCSQPEKYEAVLTKVNIVTWRTFFCRNIQRKVEQGQGQEKLKGFKFNLRMPPIGTARDPADVEFYLFMNDDPPSTPPTKVTPSKKRPTPALKTPITK